MLYLDNAATTKPYPEVIELIAATMETYFGNPSSQHDLGFQAHRQLDNARKKIAELINAKPYEIYFTSGGSESDNWALDSAARRGDARGKKHIISSEIEHHAILHKLDALRAQGFEIELLKPDNNGFVDPEKVARAITNETCLVSIMAANNEIGTIQDCGAIGRICKKSNIYFHSDAVQALPHLDIDVKKQNITMLSASAHKFGGPRGIGFLYAKENTFLTPLIYGGSQEFNSRAGTENVASIVGMAKALEITKSLFSKDHSNQLLKQKENILKKIRDFSGFHLNGGKNILPTIINFSLKDINSENLLQLLNEDEIYVSVGSACTAGTPNPSHVLKAIGLNDELAKNSVRISLSETNLLSDKEIDYLVRSFRKNISFLKSKS